jgi:hypothetical protein
MITHSRLFSNGHLIPSLNTRNVHTDPETNPNPYRPYLGKIEPVAASVVKLLVWLATLARVLYPITDGKTVGSAITTITRSSAGLLCTSKQLFGHVIAIDDNALAEISPGDTGAFSDLVSRVPQRQIFADLDFPAYLYYLTVS